MSESATNFPAYLHAEPAGWQNLLGQISEYRINIGATDHVAFDDAQRLNDTLYNLPRNQRESLRYHALGLVGCHAVDILTDNTEAALLVQAAGKEMANKAKADHDYYTYGVGYSGLRVSEIALAGLHDVKSSLAATIDAQLQPDIRIVADALTRINSVEIAHAQGDSDEADAFKQLIRVTRPLLAANHIKQNIFVGAISTYGRALEIKADIAGKKNPLVEDLVTYEQLIAMDIMKIARGAATLRIDELTIAKLRTYITDNGFGTPVFNYDRHAPLSAAPVGVQHDAPLHCPALYIREAFPLVLSLIPLIVIRAKELAKKNIDEIVTVGAYSY